MSWISHWGILTAGVVACKSGTFSYHVISTGKVCIYLELFMINDSRKSVWKKLHQQITGCYSFTTENPLFQEKFIHS